MATVTAGSGVRLIRVATSPKLTFRLRSGNAAARQSHGWFAQVADFPPFNNEVLTAPMKFDYVAGKVGGCEARVIAHFHCQGRFQCDLCGVKRQDGLARVGIDNIGPICEPFDLRHSVAVPVQLYPVTQYL